MPKKPIDHYEHPDTLPNNPTQELSGFAEEEYAPTRYPRDTALDPQLVWKGKDQQNDSDLEIHTVPIYTQEHIQPQAIIENLRTQQQRESDQTEIFFEGFNDLDFSQKIEFYQHEQNWHNRFILGDSLAVMNSLAEKEHLKGQVQMIYLDPPYGIKFSSNWQVSTRKREVSDTKVEDITPQPEQVKAFRDTWELGIHSYLTYLRDRLTVARELLSDSGSIFVQISDENVHLVRMILILMCFIGCGADKEADEYRESDGTKTLYYTVFGPDDGLPLPPITGGTVKDGDKDVDPEVLNSDGKIEIEFDRDITKGDIALETEAGEDVGWLGKVEGNKAILELVKGRELKSETTYVIRGKVSDAEGNFSDVSITFVTSMK